MSIFARVGERSWFAPVARFLVPVDRAVGRLTRGRVVALGLVPSLILTSTGRRSGRARRSPLLYVRDGAAFVVVGSNWGQPRHPGWVHNLRERPAAVVTVGGADIPVLARELTGVHRERLWQRLLTVWPAYRGYVERAGGRQPAIFRLEPQVPDTP